MDTQPLKTQNATDHKRGRIIFIFMLLLSLAGLGVSVELTDIHHATHTDPNFVSVCAMSDAVNCETVARSPFSVFLGAPVSVWGMLGYLILSFFCLWHIKGPRLHNAYPLGILTLLVATASIAAALLAFISYTRIDSICIFCMTLYGINMLLLLLMGGYLIRQRQNPARLIAKDILALISKPLILLALAVPILGATSGIMLGIEPYWQHIGWQELPELPTGVDKTGHHWIGATKPSLVIVEFSDYQCPFCRKAHKDMRLLAASYPDEIRLIHRHMPLDNACNEAIDRPFHQEACKFAKAAECAGEQNYFWKMNDALFSIQDTTRASDVDVELLAVELGIDRSSFKECMARPGYSSKLKEDMKEAKRRDIQGTPTFFIGSQPYEGKIPEITIQNALKAARKQ